MHASGISVITTYLSRSKICGNLLSFFSAYGLRQVEKFTNLLRTSLAGIFDECEQTERSQCDQLERARLE